MYACRLKTEVELMTKLNHSNIIKMYDVFEDERFLYIVMELCTGGELFDRIIQKTESGVSYSERDAARLMMQILDALEYCHANNIIHRDLKPENFLFRNKTEESDLVIIDFGLSRVFNASEGESHMSTRVGTPYYIAPEVLGRHYTSACDLWSTGVIMYILLCGAPPFFGDQDQDIFRMIKHHTVDFPNAYGWSNVSQEAKDLIKLLLSKDPDGRPTAAEAKLHKWFSVLSPGKLPMEEERASAAADGGAAAPGAGGGGTKDLSLSMRDFGRRLHTFVAMNRLKKIALNVIAAELTEAEIGDLKKLFDEIDTDHSGTLELSELENALANTHGAVHDQIFALLQGVDLDDNQSIDYHEFLAATMQRSEYMKEERIQVAFDHFAGLDANGDPNQIEFGTLVEILGGRHHAEAILVDFDVDGDRKIDFEEFKILISAGPQTPKASNMGSGFAGLSGGAAEDE